VNQSPPSFWTRENLILIGIWLVLLVGGQRRLLSDPGTFWHIVVGEQILTTGRLIERDSFSCTFAGKRWIAQWWLGECLLAFLHRVGGLDTILVFTAALLAALFAWIAHRLLRAGAHVLLAVLVTMLAFVASSYHLHPRPHIVNLVFLGWTFAWLIDAEAKRIPLGRLAWLIPLFVVWTNIHGGMVGGVATLALIVAAWSVCYLLGWQSPITRLREIAWLASITVACGLTAFVNPYGVELPRVWFSLMNSPLLPRLMEEHMPPRLEEATTWAVVMFGLVYLAALLGAWRPRPRITWLIPLVWFGLTWTRIRHGPLFAVTAAIAIADMWPHNRCLAWLAQRGSVVCRIMPRPGRSAWRGWKPWVMPGAILLASLALQGLNVAVPVLGRGWAQPNPQTCPLELLPALRVGGASERARIPIFNDMRFGGFLIYYAPEYSVFIDDRCELYGDQWLERYADVSNHHPEQMEDWSSSYSCRRALVVAGSPLDRFLGKAPGWVLIARAEMAALYGRDDASPVKP
jgi:hypothetical protein